MSWPPPPDPVEGPLRYGAVYDDVTAAIGRIETVREALAMMAMLAAPDVKTHLGVLSSGLLDAVNLIQKDMP